MAEEIIHENPEEYVVNEPMKSRTESSVDLKLPENYIEIVKQETFVQQPDKVEDALLENDAMEQTYIKIVKQESLKQSSEMTEETNLEVDKPEEHNESEILKSVYVNSDLTELLNEELKENDVMKDTINTPREDSFQSNYQNIDNNVLKPPVKENSEIFIKQTKNLQDENSHSMNKTYDLNKEPCDMVTLNKQDSYEKALDEENKTPINSNDMVVKENSVVHSVTQIRIYSPSPAPSPTLLQPSHSELSKTHRVYDDCFDGSLYPSDLQNDIKRPTINEPSPPKIQQTKSNSYVYFDASLYPNINPVDESSQNEVPIENKVNYYDSSLYPSTSPEVALDALSINIPLNTDIINQDQYFDSSLYPTKFISNEIITDKVKTPRIKSAKKEEIQKPYFDSSLYPIERSKTQLLRVNNKTNQSTQDQYFDSSLYPHENEPKLIEKKVIQKLPDPVVVPDIIDKEETKPKISNNIDADTDTDDLTRAQLNKYPYTRSEPELDPLTPENSSPNIRTSQVNNNSQSTDTNILKSRTTPTKSISSIDIQSDTHKVVSKNEESVTSSQNLDDVTPTMYNNGNENYNNMNGNNNITYRNTNNTFRQQHQQQPQSQPNNQLYYETEVLNEIRRSNNSVQSNRQSYTGQQPSQNQYKKPQLLPPLPNNSSNNPQYNGPPQQQPNVYNNNYPPNNYVANPANGYPPYPNSGFANQGVDPRAINNPYSGYGQNLPFGQGQSYDPVTSRRRLLKQLSVNTQLVASQTNLRSIPHENSQLNLQLQYGSNQSMNQQLPYQPPYQPQYPSQLPQYTPQYTPQYPPTLSRRGTGFYSNLPSTNENSAINYNNSGFSGSILNDRREKIDQIREETLASNDVDDLIDQMAKRRIAIKKLEIEMSRQATRTSALIRQSAQGQPYPQNYPFSDISNPSFIYNSVNTSIAYDPRTSTYSTRPPPPILSSGNILGSSNFPSSRQYDQNGQTEEIYPINNNGHSTDNTPRDQNFQLKNSSRLSFTQNSASTNEDTRLVLSSRLSDKNPNKFPSLNNTGDISVQSVNDDPSTNQSTAVNSISNSQPLSRQQNNRDDFGLGESQDGAKLNDDDDDIFNQKLQDNKVDSNNRTPVLPQIVADPNERTPVPPLAGSLVNEKTIYPNEHISIDKKDQNGEVSQNELLVGSQRTSEQVAEAKQESNNQLTDDAKNNINNLLKSTPWEVQAKTADPVNVEIDNSTYRKGETPVPEKSEVLQQNDSDKENPALKDEYYDDESKTVEGQNGMPDGSKETSEQVAEIKLESGKQLTDSAKDEMNNAPLEVSEKTEDKTGTTNKDEDEYIQNKNDVAVDDENKVSYTKKFPGLGKRGKYFWGAATVVRFICRVKASAAEFKKVEDSIAKPAEVFRIRLWEILTAIHRVYLEPDGPIYGSLITYLKNPNDMSILFNMDHELYSPCVDIVTTSVIDIIQNICEFLPKEGILGANQNSALVSLIANENRFPDYSFMDTERERIEFDEHRRTKDVNQDRSTLLVMWAFITRGLIMTLLLKPLKFKIVSSGDWTPLVEGNFKMLATILFYIVRQVSDNTDVPLDFPWEFKYALYSDDKMKHFYGDENIDMMINRAKMMFKVWTDEYIKRLDEASGTSR